MKTTGNGQERLLKTILTWVSRATGFGYEQFPPLDPYKERSVDLVRKSDTLVTQVEKLDRELRRHGRLSSDS